MALPGLAEPGVRTMGQRHEIQNLARRGNVFYWRPRVPARFSGSVTGSRLSLSLRQSDHRKAGYVARRLNILLHDLALKPTVRMTTKEQLAKLFKAEIDRMHDHLEQLALASRRIGRPDDVTQIEADIEVGWAYRLLQLFGTMRELAFDPGCAGRAQLVRAGIPDAHIENIAETFRSEQRGSRRGAFERQVAAHMADVGLPDTALNRERAMVEIFRAKADVLLDVSDRYPLVDRERSRLTRKTPEVIGQAEPQQPIENQATDTLSLSTVSRSIGPADPELVDRPASALRMEPQIEHDDHSDPVPPKNSSGSKRQLPLAGFLAECKNLIDNHRDDWASDTAADVEVLVSTFKGILEEHGVAHSGEITQAHVAALRQHFNHIPARYGQSSRQRALSPAELREFAARQTAIAERTGAKPPKIGLSAATIRRHLGNLDHFLKHLRASDYEVPAWTFDGLRPKKPKKGVIRHKQVKPAPTRVRPIFDLPIFTGCRSDEQPEVAGQLTIHCALYFLPMFYAYLGPRRFEIAGLAPQDVIETENGWAIHIRDNEFRRIKNVQSDRVLPIPDEVLRLNFLEYSDRIRNLGHKQLFPELFSPFLKENDPGDRFYKNFIPILKAAPNMHGELWDRTIHALRHGFADTLKQAGASTATINDISGRIGTGETETRYTNPAGLPLIKAEMARYPIITGHLEPKPIRLLRWVEARQPPPWAGKPRTERFAAHD